MINGNMTLPICNYKKEKDSLENPAIFQIILKHIDPESSQWNSIGLFLLVI